MSKEPAAMEISLSKESAPRHNDDSDVSWSQEGPRAAVGWKRRFVAMVVPVCVFGSCLLYVMTKNSDKISTIKDNLLGAGLQGVGLGAACHVRGDFRAQAKVPKGYDRPNAKPLGEVGTDSAELLKKRTILWSGFQPFPGIEPFSITGQSGLAPNPLKHDEVMKETAALLTKFLEKHPEISAKGILWCQEQQFVATKCASFMKGFFEEHSGDFPRDHSEVKEVGEVQKVGSLRNAIGYYARLQYNASVVTTSELGNYFFALNQARIKEEHFKSMIDCAEATEEIIEKYEESLYRLAAQPVQHLSRWGGRLTGFKMLLRKAYSGRPLAPYKDFNALSNRNLAMFEDFVVASFVAYTKLASSPVAYEGAGPRGHPIFLKDVIRFVSVNVMAQFLVDGTLVEKIKDRCGEKCQSLGMVDVGEGDLLPKKEVIEAVKQLKQATHLRAAFADGRPSLARDAQSDPEALAKHWFHVAPKSGEGSEGSEGSEGQDKEEDKEEEDKEDSEEHKGGGQTTTEDLYWDIRTEVAPYFDYFKIDIEFVEELTMDRPPVGAQKSNAWAQEYLVGRLRSGEEPELFRFNFDLHEGKPTSFMPAIPIYIQIFHAVKELSEKNIPCIFEFSLQRGLSVEEMKNFADAPKQVQWMGHRVFLVAILALDRLEQEKRTAANLANVLRELASLEHPFQSGDTMKKHLGAANLWDALQRTDLSILIQGAVRGPEAWGYPDFALEEMNLELRTNTDRYLAIDPTTGQCRPLP